MKKIISLIFIVVLIFSSVFHPINTFAKDSANAAPSQTSIPGTQHPKVQIEMQDGSKMVFELYTEFAPKTVENFLTLVRSHFYDGLKFHRIIEGFMIQGGDPKGDGTGGSNKTITGEFSQNGFTQNTLRHTKGVISMARSSDPNSASSQFFIMDGDGSWLDGQYAAFGKLIEGEAVLDKIAGTTVVLNPYTGESSLPKTDVIMKKVTVLQDTSIVEKKDFRIVINGKVKKFNSVPIIANGKFMLPIDELLNYIEIPKSSIVWNQKNQSCKVINGKNIIEIKIGKKIASVNGKSVNFDAETVMYKNRTYISINSVQLFDRVIYLDKNTNTYLINTRTTFVKVKQIIEKMDKSISAIKKFKASLSDYDYSNFDNNIKSLNEKIAIQKDNVGKISYFKVDGTRGKSEHYIFNGNLYLKLSNEKQWGKTKYDSHMIEANNFFGLSDLYEKNNTFYAGLTAAENLKTKEIKLSGSSYNMKYVFSIIEGGIRELLLDDYSYEITIDMSTYRLKNVKFHLKGKNKTNDYSFNFEKKFEISISDMNGNFKIVLPKETKNAKLLE